MWNRHLTAHDEQWSRMIAQTRDLCRASAQMLGQPQPDTFLGRKTHETGRVDDPEDSPVKGSGSGATKKHKAA
jgi:hypothetical protein